MTTSIVRRCTCAALTAAAALLSLTAVAVAVPAVGHADPGCTDIPYYGCIYVPNAEIPSAPGVPANIPVPAWTPAIDLCGPLGGHQIIVGNICI